MPVNPSHEPQEAHAAESTAQADTQPSPPEFPRREPPPFKPLNRMRAEQLVKEAVSSESSDDAVLALIALIGSIANDDDRRNRDDVAIFVIDYAYTCSRNYARNFHRFVDQAAKKTH